MPGIGKKSAQRMALYLIDKNKDGAKLMANSILEAVENIKDVKGAECLLLKIFVIFVLIKIEIKNIMCC